MTKVVFFLLFLFGTKVKKNKTWDSFPFFNPTTNKTKNPTRFFTFSYHKNPTTHKSPKSFFSLSISFSIIQRRAKRQRGKEVSE